MGRMHADQIDIDAALVRELLAADFPGWADLPLRPVVSAGTVNAIFRLGDELAVRLPLTAGGVADLATEQQWVPWLAPKLPVGVPLPVGQGRPGAGYPFPWSVFRWQRGTNPDVDALADPDGLADDLAEFVAVLRGIDPAGAPDSPRAEALAERDHATRTAIRQLAGEIDTGAVTAAWEDALAATVHTGPPTWIHGDFSPGNVLVDGAGRLAAVLDFGCLGLGDPAVDLIAAWNLLPARVRPRLRAGADDAMWLRARGWVLSISLIQLPYYRDTNPAMAANSRHVIKEVLAERAALG
jgi:aminoglycoside phosphotransferase (APT) family kinase protein